MEKAHGWTYIRSKNNGKVSRKPQSGKTPPTPQISTPGSIFLEMPTPDVRKSTVGSESPLAAPYSRSANAPVLPPEGSAPYAKDRMMDYDETIGPFNPDLSWNSSHNDFGTDKMSTYTSSSHRPSWDATSSTATFEPSFIPQNAQQEFLDNFDWSNMDNMNNDLQSMNVQLFTPAASVDNQPYIESSRNQPASFEQEQKIDVQSFSPGAQENTMLYSPFSNNANDFGVDETYGDFTCEVQKSSQDFTLYSDATVPTVTDNLFNQSMFQDLNNLNSLPSTWSGRGLELAQQFGLPDFMEHE